MKPITCFTAAILAVQMLGCASPRLLLQHPGTLHLARGDRSIEITNDRLLTIEWSADGVSHCSRAMVDGKEEPVPVRLVEASEHALRLKSDAWDQLEDIPASYRKLPDTKIIPRDTGHKKFSVEILSDMRIIPGGAGHRKPTVVIPIRQIREIGIYREIPRLARCTRKDIVTGALGAATGIMTGVASRHVSEPDQGDEVLVGVAIGALVGGIVYPVYKFFKPQYEPEPEVYPIDEGTGYRIEIRPLAPP